MAKPWLMRFRGETIPYAPRLLKRSEGGAKGSGLPTVWIGFDTEAASDKNRLIKIREFELEKPAVQTMQTHNGIETKLEYVSSPEDVFRHFWSIVIRSIPEEQFRSTKNKPNTVPVYCHNWAGYDWGMIVKDAPEGWRNQSKMNHFYPGFTDEVKVERTKWKLTIEGGHMQGNAPMLRIIASRKNLHVRLVLLDTIPFFPKALATAAKELGLEKGDRASVIGIDWRTKSYDEVVIAKNEKGETVEVRKRDFEEYARHDPEIVWKLAERIREMHKLHHLQSLAVSGAGYAAKVLMRNLDAPVVGSHGGFSAVQIALDAFHGGRSGRLVHGKVEGCSMYDFRSSYPSIQTRLPVLHSDYTLVYRHRNLPVEEFMKMAKRLHGFARVSGIERDEKYPSLLSANTKGSIRPVVGEFKAVPATAAEIYMGVVFGGLEITSVEEAIFYEPKEGLENVYPFRGFIQTAWDEKNSFPKGTIEYDSAKIRANSGYGKMIEHRGMKKFLEDDIQIPLSHMSATTPDEAKTHARNFFLEYHPDYWFEAAQTFIDQTKGFPVMGYTQVRDLLNASAEFGYYAIPQYATWITGHAHARLVLMMRLFEGIKWDTDSVTTKLSEAEVKKRLKRFPKTKLPTYIQPLTIGDDLGELDLEAKNMSGVILGNKRYYLEGLVSKKGEWVPGAKYGFHGLPGIKKEDIRPILLGEKPRYTPKAKPIKMGGAKTWDEVGLFITGSRKKAEISPQFLPDPKQNFAAGGRYLPFAGFQT